MSANHILQNFLSAENFPELKWALRHKHKLITTVLIMKAWNGTKVTKHLGLFYTSNFGRVECNSNT